MHLPENLCQAAETGSARRFSSVDELLTFVLKELTRDDAERLDEREQRMIEDRLAWVGVHLQDEAIRIQTLERRLSGWFSVAGRYEYASFSCSGDRRLPTCRSRQLSWGTNVRRLRFSTRWLSESFVVPNAIVGGVPTYYSFPAILASRHPLAMGRDLIGIAPGETTLTSYFNQSGYATAAFVAANPYVSVQVRLRSGVRHFRDFLDQPVTTSVIGAPVRIQRDVARN